MRIAELPLHHGRAPRWLFSRMVRLSKVILDYMSYCYSPGEILRRLADPFWFQALSCVLGFDWHSSGTTTTTLGALKQACKPEEHGIAIAGGKGRASRRTPEEIELASEFFNLSSKKVELLKKASYLSAKVDNACVQDGYELYHHSFIFTEKGDWAVVQQGMRAEEKLARRYHWLSPESFVVEPHQAILAQRVETQTLNMTARESEEARKASLDLVRDNPAKLRSIISGNPTLDSFLSMPRRHRIMRVDISEQGWRALRAAYEIQPENYEELIALRGIGGKTIRALALLSELLFGTEPCWKDPAKFSFAHGGKDGIPYPVDLKTYEESIAILKNALQDAKLGNKEKHRALIRLKNFVQEKSPLF